MERINKSIEADLKKRISEARAAVGIAKANGADYDAIYQQGKIDALNYILMFYGSDDVSKNQ